MVAVAPKYQILLPTLAVFIVPSVLWCLRVPSFPSILSFLLQSWFQLRTGSIRSIVSITRIGSVYLCNVGAKALHAAILSSCDAI